MNAVADTMPVVAEKKSGQADSKRAVAAKPVEAKVINKKPGRSTDTQNATQGAAMNLKGATEPAIAGVTPDNSAYIQITCRDGTNVFLDGFHKNAVSDGTLTLKTKPGKHKLIVSNPGSNVYSDELDLEAGKTVRIKPKVCQ
jgi:hypothetical protein